MSTPQQDFDEKYISSSEIVRRLRINRVAVSIALKRGVLPPPIVVNKSCVHVWERDHVENVLRTWEADLNAKRAQRA